MTEMSRFCSPILAGAHRCAGGRAGVGLPSLRPRLAALTALALLAGCTNSGAQEKGGATAKAGGPPAVGFIVVAPKPVEQLAELPGRTTSFQASEVRPQVSGIIRRRAFTEGGYVRAGQTLYEIDPSLFRAAADVARANLANAEAGATAAQVRAERLRPLADAQAVSAQDYTDALAQSRQALAAVAQQRALLASAQITLRLTRVPAPISGRIGRSRVTQGALVTANQAEALAVIQRLDPIYVDIQQSSAAVLALRRALAEGGAVPARATVRLALEDGADYGLTGTVEFAEVVVDETTGTVTLRAQFPNPQGLLLPGMFVRARFAQAIATNAFLVPQQAVTRDPRGNARVMVIGAGNVPADRLITTVRTQGPDWVVTDGLKPGERVIVEGLTKVKPGKPVKPVPFGSPQRIAAPPEKGAVALPQGR